MKKNFAFACVSLLIFAMVISCNEEGGPTSVNNRSSNSDTPDFSALKSSGVTEEELVRMATDYIWFVRENLVAGSRKSVLTENELNSLRNAQSDRQLSQAIRSLGGDGEGIVKSYSDYRRLAKYMADQHLDVAHISKLIARKITEKVYQRRFSTAKMPDCAGLCSQQFNIDIESCENALALEIGATLAAGVLAGGMVGAGGFIFAVGTYFNCESTAFLSFDVCSMNCGMN